MGGADLGPASSGKKKPLDTTINLVPFIDLMAGTIRFLIMTAVWTQIGRLQVSGAGGPSDNADEMEKTVPLTLLIPDKGMKTNAGTSPFDPFPILRHVEGRIELRE